MLDVPYNLCCLCIHHFLENLRQYNVPLKYFCSKFYCTQKKLLDFDPLTNLCDSFFFRPKFSWLCITGLLKCGHASRAVLLNAERGFKIRFGSILWAVYFFFNVPFMHIDIEVVITMLSNIVTGKIVFCYQNCSDLL